MCSYVKMRSYIEMRSYVKGCICSIHTDMTPLALIHFDGPWSESKRELVQQAARDVEATWPSRATGPESPWIMVCSEIMICAEAETKWIYLASHVQVETIFKAESPGGLATRIREFFTSERPCDKGERARRLAPS